MFRGAVLDLDGGIVARAEVARDGAHRRGRGRRGLEALVDAAPRDRDRRRCSASASARPVSSTRHGVVRSAPNLGWSGVPLQARLADAPRVPVHVANDANVAVLAEHSFGDARRRLLLIKIGHGVGAGLIVGGRPVIGGGFAAGEIGHVVVGTDGGPRCACGKHGCLEAWLAAPRLTAQLAELDGDDAAGASARDEILREAGRRLGIVLAPVVGALNLSEIVLSGPARTA